MVGERAVCFGGWRTRGLAFVAALLWCLVARGELPWSELTRPEGPAWVRAGEARYVRFDLDAIGRVLSGATPRVVLPRPEGGIAEFDVEDALIFEGGKSSRLGSCRAFVGRGVSHPLEALRLEITPRGLSAQVVAEGRAWYIDPASVGDGAQACVYRGEKLKRDLHAWACRQIETGFSPRGPGAPHTGESLRTIRMALAATGEYTAIQGGVAGVQGAIATLLNRLNGVYEPEVTARFVLIPGNDALIFTDELTDPYTNSSIFTMLGENQIAIDGAIGDAGYDLGHVLGTSNGGIANIAVVCQSGSKARGVTASPFAPTDAYSVYAFCHEVGHQLGALHTFNGVSGSCTAGQRSSAGAYEPGSGSTLMSYDGFCGSDNITGNLGSLYLHGDSLARIDGVLDGVGCLSVTPTGNSPPAIGPLTEVSLPVGTPFELRATASDADTDPVTLCWEQMDLGPASALGVGDTGVGPWIRSRPPASGGVRSIPRLDELSSGIPAIGESVPTVARVMHWRVTARDNRATGGGVTSADVTVNVVGTAGPFRVTSPNTGVSWVGPQTVTWDVASTDGAGIGVANVRILLSVDGGLTFPEVLAASVPNAGTASVVIPEIPTTRARVRVEAIGGVFFDVSDVDFGIPCNPPTNVAATSGECSGVTVTWDAIPGALGYTLWRGTTNDSGLAFQIASVSAAQHFDPTAVVNTNYFYWVKTLGIGCVSGFSASASGVRVPLTGTVQGVAAAGECAGVRVSWTAFPGATLHRVYRSASGSPIGATLVGGSPSTQFLDDSANSGETWNYFVRGVTPCGITGFGTSASGTRPGPPGPPSGVIATIGLCDGVHLTWDALASATGYEVLRSSTTEIADAVLIATPSAAAYDDVSATPDMVLHYWIRGVNACGEGGPSQKVGGSRSAAPAIVSPPQSVNACAGGDAVFTILVTGTGPITYRWFVNGSEVGGNSPTLTLSSVTTAMHAQGVRCEVSNLCGMVVSPEATLGVRVCGPALYVDSSAPPGGNGSGWASAFRGLRDALQYALTEATVSEIWVAEGTHVPGNARGDSFVPRGGLTILGGFPAGGGPLQSRDPALHPTILSGDLLSNDHEPGGESENAHHVLRISAAVILDGLTITRGYADAAGHDAGAGVLVEPAGVLTLRDSLVTHCTAGGPGGGVRVETGASCIIERSSIRKCRGGEGGGVSSSGVTTLTNCTLENNVAEAGVAPSGPTTGRGGAVFASPPGTAIAFCTIADNSAEHGGGVGGGGITLSRSILARNTAAGSGDDASDPVVSLGFNVLQSLGVAGLVPTDLEGASAGLGQFGYHGGATPVFALRLDSPAIDFVQTTPCLSSDQRGEPRPIDGDGDGALRCDAGAFEAPEPCVADFDDGSATGTRDGGVTVDDLIYYLQLFEVGDVAADVDDGSGTGQRDLGVTIDDLVYFISRFEGGC